MSLWQPCFGLPKLPSSDRSKQIEELAWCDDPNAFVRTERQQMAIARHEEVSLRLKGGSHDYVVLRIERYDANRR
jgi:hypothetical protein